MNELGLNMRWQSAVGKALAALALAMVCAVLPLAEWAPLWFLKIQLPITSFVLVCYLGKLLYDTFFYDHYWP